MMDRLLALLFFAFTLVAIPALRAQPAEVFGLDHAPLGQTNLTVLPGGGDPSLLVSNIGSSGLDGVAVVAGTGEVFDFLCVEVAEPLPTASPDFTFRAFAGSPLPVVLGRLREVGLNYEFSASFPSSGGAPQRISVYDDGLLVAEGTANQGTPVKLSDWPTFVDPHKARPFPFPGPDLPVPTGPPVPQDGPWPVAFSLIYSQDVQVTLPGGVASGDIVVVEPVKGVAHDGLTRMEVTAAGVSRFTIRGEMLGAFGLPHVAIGAASFAPEQDRLTVGNLGQGGGVFVGRLPGLAPFDFEFLPFSFGTSQEGRLKAFRNPQGPGDPGEVAAELRLQQTGGLSARGGDRDTLKISVSPRSSQASDARAEVLDQQGLPKAVVLIPIDDLDDFTTVLSVASALPTVAGGSSAPKIERLGAFVPPPFPAPFSPEASGFTGRFDGPVTFTFPNDTVVDGFGFKLSLLGGQPSGNLSGVSLEVSNGLARGAAPGGLDEIVIVDEVLATPIVGVSAEPMAPPVVIGPGGGSFQWRFRAANAGAVALPVTFRSEVVLPNGTVLPILGPVTETLPAESAVSRTFAQGVPAAAPAGTYVYRVQGRLPDSTLVTDAFILRKTPTSGVAATGGGDWSIVEVPEPQAAEAAVRSDEALGLTSYPNPASGWTTLAFSLDARAEVRLAVYDLLGREVAVLLDDITEAGPHEAGFDTSALPSGVYLVRLDTGGTVQTQRLIVVR